ncbi:MAG: efflux RND transporter permease subunit [bacterium]|nr:efflux RND transporter permease subunit [bacterium]
MKQISYLKQLTFDPKLEGSLIAKYLTNPRLLVLLLITILGIGLTSYLTLPKRLNPEIKIPIVLVSTVLPGAGPQDVESLLTVPLEDTVLGLDQVKTVASSSRDSVSILQIEFNSGVDPDKARSDVQSAIDTATLPENAKTPKAQKLDFENQPVWTFSLSTKGDTASLMRFSQTLKDKLKDLPSIEKVDTSGLDTQEVQIVLKPEAISTYGLNPMQFAGLITTATASYPAGAVETGSGSYSLTIDQQVTTVEDIRSLKLNLSGSTVSLGNIATVQEITKPGQLLSYVATPESGPRPAVTFYVFKTSTANIDKAAGDAQKEAAALTKPYSEQFTLESIQNTADEIDRQFGELLRDFAIISVLIFIVLFIFLGLRQAIVAVVSAPLTFLITFSVMQGTGITLNFLSMFSLLLALGLLVDDTIVVISAMTAYFRTGKFTPIQTGLLVWRDFLVAIFTTTITTVWAFLPLLLSTGIIGEFIKSIPIVVSSTLIASFFVAMFITLPTIIILLSPNLPKRVITLLKIILILGLAAVLFAILPKGPLFPLEVLAAAAFLFVTQSVRLSIVKKSSLAYEKAKRTNVVVREMPKYVDDGIIHFGRISNKYHNLIYRILTSSANRKRAIIMVILFSLFSYILLPLGFVKNEFFPKSDQDFLYLSLEMPPGTNAATTQKAALSIAESIRMYKESVFTTVEVGRGIGENGGSQGSASNNALITMRLIEHGKRHTSSIDIATTLRNQFINFDQGRLSVVEISGGPPAGADIQIKLFGDDLTVLNTYTDKLQKQLASFPGVTNVDKSVKPGTAKLVFTPDMAKLAARNMTLDTLGFWLRFYASGFSPKTIKLPDAKNVEKDITLRMEQGIPVPETLTSIRIPTQNGQVTLTDLGTLRVATNPTLITREDGKRTISVTAGVAKGYSSGDIGKKLEEYADNGLNLPEGYTWKTGGVNEENNNSVTSILEAMLLSFLLIIVTMVLQFSSFRKALIVMLVIPLSISGVFIIFALTGTPLSFPALIGVLALFGIVVKNSILIVDKIKQNEDAGMPFIDAVVDGSSSRLEAIALTSFTAIIGLIPITLSDPLWQGLGGAIISGLAFSGTIMLFFIPVVYYYWFAPKSSSRGR